MAYKMNLLPTPVSRMRTDCDGCGERQTLTTIDGDGILIGDECPSCGYYTTRYMPGMEPQ